ncbi:glycosyltransferase family 59 protein [Myriangium duriaei CBS 260.36]|uniref:Dol-P-Glc:Glc(2)Man(9)GlcNAc(2)-PP-Dol alpha-1,2-glucosyltransferase n=1 Tax=Myriangium duriaei CBS 260.36 TaxID=1168546 RepID=A0A9P4IV68_9PEZI|nr:glycosyltransferase family 59 protein [Myriangium duriaei CBS 260.36]
MAVRVTPQSWTNPLLSVPVWTAIAVLGALIGIWSGFVFSVVTEPYLDEVFHVGQAQKYLAGRYLEWDPKITTPPALYVLSTLLSWVTGLSSTNSLRAINGLLLPCLVFILLDMEMKLKSIGKNQNDRNSNSGFSAHQLHVAFNIALFPPLFFFSALYYTDIAAVVSVLLCWNSFLRSHARAFPTVLQDISTIFWGVISLTFRQTNIFWVSIFPAAILLVSRIDVGLDDPDGKEGTLLDSPVREASVDEYLWCILSLVQRFLRIVQLSFSGRYAFLRLVRLLIPYAIILAFFAGFVLWNGGVVLGDKSNHIATIHLPQMLYIWPYMLFFSFPLAYPYIIQGLFSLLGRISAIGSLEFNLMFKRKDIFPRTTPLLIFALIAGFIIYFNTIIHPFTLADNRHYMFYIFRLLTHYRITKFLVIPVYAVGSWAIIQTLGAPACVGMVADKKSGTASVKAERTSDCDKAGPPPARPLRLNLAVAREGAPVSFVLVWLVTTTLQLVTAPLVEPRYFILPWIMWRIRVPRAGQEPQRGSEKQSLVQRMLYEHDHRLWIETAWFLVVNAVTGYIFLYWGFEWVQEEGKVQRFMW